jgi:hypothetical protein
LGDAPGREQNDEGDRKKRVLQSHNPVRDSPVIHWVNSECSAGFWSQSALPLLTLLLVK